MDGVMHPVGPEEESTYWVRRALVLGAILLLIIGVAAGVNSLNGASAESAEQPAPAAAPSTEPAPNPEPSPAVGAPTPVPDANAPAAPAPASPEANKPAETMPPDNPAPAPSNMQPQATTQAAEPAQPAAPAQVPEPAAAVGVCETKSLAAKVTSVRDPKINSLVVYKVEVANNGPADCTVDLNSTNYEFKIYSGNDRIWSTADCTEKAPSLKTNLKKGQAASFDVTWPGDRSKAKCGVSSEAIKPGTYVATVAIKDAKPAQYVQLFK